MAHFAKINNENIVEQIISINDQNCCGGQYPESESCGQEYIASIGLQGIWKQTSYNNNFRKRYAGIGFKYDSELDIFIGPKPFNTWIFSLEDQDWIAPIPFPQDGQKYYWDDILNNWVLHDSYEELL